MYCLNRPVDVPPAPSRRRSEPQRPIAGIRETSRYAAQATLFGSRRSSRWPPERHTGKALGLFVEAQTAALRGEGGRAAEGRGGTRGGDRRSGRVAEGRGQAQRPQAYFFPRSNSFLKMFTGFLSPSLIIPLTKPCVFTMIVSMRSSFSASVMVLSSSATFASSSAE